MHCFELHSNKSACRKSGRLGLEQAAYVQGFDYESITFKADVSMFERV